MTKREFDRASKIDFGMAMASDERRSYRQERSIAGVRDYITERAAQMAYRNAPGWIGRDGFLPTLAIGSRYRSVAAYRAHAKAPLLG